MKFRQKHNKFSILLLIGLVLALALGCVSVEAAPKWEFNDYNTIKKGDVEYFVEDNTLNKRVNGKDKVLTKWNLTGKDYLTILSAYKNNIYINLIHWIDGKPIIVDLYTVNYKTGKKVKSITSFLPEGVYGPYIYGRPGNADNYAINTVYIWKASGSKMKRIGKLCDSPAGSPTVLNKKLYFASYQEINGSVMDVYRSNLVGKGRKKLFTFESKGGVVNMDRVENNKIMVSEYINHRLIYYEYDIKTGKLSQVS